MLEPQQLINTTNLKYRHEIFFPTLKFLDIKSLIIDKDVDARNTPYYWMKKKTNGIEAHYQEVYKITAYCDFDFLDFPFEMLQCNAFALLKVTQSM